MQRVENCKCDSIPKGMRKNYTIFTRSQVFYCEQVHLSVVGVHSTILSFPSSFIFLEQSDLFLGFSPASFRRKVRFATDLSTMVNLTKYEKFGRSNSNWYAGGPDSFQLILYCLYLLRFKIEIHFIGKTRDSNQCITD